MALPTNDWGPPQGFEIPDGGMGGGGGGGGVTPGTPGFFGFVPGLAPNSTPSFTSPYGGMMRRRLPGRGASPYAAAPMSGMPLGQFPTSPGGAMQLAGGLAPLNFGPVQGWANAAQSGTLNGGGQGGGQSFNWGVLNEAIRRASEGGLFGLEPPAGLMNAVRQQGVADAGARGRSARLGLQSRFGQGDVDPTTFAFQTLMSDLGGQDQTSDLMGRADLAARMQQYQFLQDLFRLAIGGQQQTQVARAAGENFDWGGLAGGLGGLLGAA